MVEVTCYLMITRFGNMRLGKEDSFKIVSALILFIVGFEILWTFSLIGLISFFQKPTEVIETFRIDPVPNILIKLVGLTVAIVLVFIFITSFQLRIIWRRSWKRILRDCVYAVAMVVFILGLFYILGIEEDPQFSINNYDSFTTPLLYLLLMLIVSIHEEIVFRFIPLIARNQPLSYFISALIFSLIHIGNSNNIIFLLNVFLIGIILSIYTWYTRTLIFPICFHFIWNAILGPLLGTPVSGISLPSWFTTKVILKGYHSDQIGMESSIVLTAILFIFIVVLYIKWLSGNCKSYI